MDGAPEECSRSRRLEELCLMCLMHRVCGTGPGFDRRFTARTVWARRRRRVGDARAAHRLGHGCSLSLLLVG